MIENVHAETYALLIDTLLTSDKLKQDAFSAIKSDHSIKEKAEWAMGWIKSKTASFAMRVLAFACVEGIFFSSKGSCPTLCTVV